MKKLFLLLSLCLISSYALGARSRAPKEDTPESASSKPIASMSANTHHDPENTPPMLQDLTQVKDWLNVRNPLSGKDLKGRIVLIDFWTFCCINCIHIAQELKELEAEFGDEIAVIGVHSAKFENERNSDQIRQAVLRYDIEHPVINDQNFKIWNAFNVKAWPTLVLLDPNGNLADVFSGEGKKDQIRNAIHRLQKEFGGNINTTPLPLALEKEKDTASGLRFPGKITYAPIFQKKPTLFIADTNNHRIVAVRPDGEVIGTVGSGKPGHRDGSFKEAQFNNPQGMAYQVGGVLYIADTGNHLLRKVDFNTQKVTTLAGTGKRGFILNPDPKADPILTPLASPWDITFYPNPQTLAIAMAGTHQIWTYNIEKKSLDLLAGSGRESIDDGTTPRNSMAQPSGLAAVNNVLFIADSETSALRQYHDNTLNTLIGEGLFDFGFRDGPRRHARMQHALGLDARQNKIYITDTYNHAIRLYEITMRDIQTLTGDPNQPGFEDGSLNDALFNEPSDVAIVGDVLYIADTNNHAIRVVNLKDKKVSTLKLRVPKRPTRATSQS